MLARSSNDDRAAREEIFGPVACVIPFDGEEEAVRLANDTIYGLSGSVWTATGPARCASRGRSRRACCRSTRTPRCGSRRPFGGFKQSGIGRELGPDALEHYTEVKNVYFKTE